jgi:hypothetical protein
MFDLVFRYKGLLACFEVQTSDYHGHKPEQRFAQELFVTQVASSMAIAYKTIAETASGKPQLLRISIDRKSIFDKKRGAGWMRPRWVN